MSKKHVPAVVESSMTIFDAQVQAIDDVKSIYLGIDALNPYFGKVERQGETLVVSNPNPNVARFRQV